MTDLEVAIQRMMVWILEYGDQKPPVFIGDVSLLLLAAKESEAYRSENTQLQTDFAEVQDARDAAQLATIKAEADIARLQEVSEIRLNEIRTRGEENARLQTTLDEIRSELYGKDFEVLGFHVNGSPEPLDSWFNDNGWIDEKGDE